MRKYYPGDTLPDGWYWLFCASYNQPESGVWNIDLVKDNKVPDFRGEYVDEWDEVFVSMAFGPLTPPE